MLNHQRRAVRSVMDMSLFLMLLLSGLLCTASGLQKDYHYIYMSQKMSWSSAQSYCRERFTDLATVDSMDDVNMMMNKVNDGYSGSVWIGLKRATQSRWGWSYGDAAISDYTPWWPGEPSGDGLCGVFRENVWHDLPCANTYFFVCYNENTGYHYIRLLKTWTDAQSYCRQYHTDLATVDSDVKQNQIYSTVGNDLWFWIGLFRDTWQWSDQWSLFFRNWAGGPQFPSSESHCVAMSTTDSGKWIQVSCTEQHPFICYGDVQKQVVRLFFSHDGKTNLNDPSVQTAILNQITEKLKSAGLDSRDAVNWRKDEDGEVFHPENHTVQSIIKCDQN